MWDTLMLHVRGDAVPTAIQVTEETYQRFVYLQTDMLENKDIPDLIMKHDKEIICQRKST